MRELRYVFTKVKKKKKSLEMQVDYYALINYTQPLNMII